MNEKKTADQRCYDNNVIYGAPIFEKKWLIGGKMYSEVISPIIEPETNDQHNHHSYYENSRYPFPDKLIRITCTREQQAEVELWSKYNNNANKYFIW